MSPVRPPRRFSLRSSLGLAALISAAALASAPAQAQPAQPQQPAAASGAASATLTGTVVNAATGAPVALALVAAGALEVLSGDDGRFTLDGVGRGVLDLVVVADGYEPLVQRVRAGVPLRLALIASEGAGGSELIRIEERRKLEPSAPGLDLGREVLRTLPGTGNDALKSVQSLPGTARVPFGLGGLVLRGFSPRDSNVFLDGIEVPILYHFGGLASFFPSTMIESLELVSSGYGARYGRGQGGLVEIRSRESRATRWSVAGEVSLLDASATAEGPAAGGSVTLGVRRSFIDAVLAAVPTSDLTIAPRYLDSQLRWQSKSGTWTALLFGADDGIDLDTDTQDDAAGLDLRQSFVRAGLRYRKRHDQLEVTVLPWLGFDRNAVITSDDEVIRSNVTFATRATVQRDLPHGFLAGGLDLQGNRYGYEIDNEPPALPSGMMQTPSRIAGVRWTSDLAAWTEVAHRFADDKFTVQLGARGERLGLTREWVLDPRLTLRQQLTPKVTLSQTLGRYHQPALATASDYQLPGEPFRASQAWQASAGVEVVSSILGGDVSTTAFGAQLSDLPVDVITGATPISAPGSAASGGAAAASRELLEEQVGRYSYQANRGRGLTYGVEAMIRRRIGAVQGWIAYTYARSYRQGDPWALDRYVPYVLDQPHVLTALASAPIGASWRLGARVRYATGNPITPTVGSYFDTGPQEYVPLSGRTLSARLPAFVQLDVRVDRMWRRPWGNLKLFLDVQNVSNRVNPEGVTYNYDYSERQYTRGLPVFPSLGLEYTP
jgi:TonB-dependent Receptor Plug Domain/Carboxypeptidase regulatory-like domain